MVVLHFMVVFRVVLHFMVVLFLMVGVSACFQCLNHFRVSLYGVPTPSQF